MVQIDGLGRSALTRAMEAGRTPFLSALLSSHGYQMNGVYSGLPSSTPAVQAELFYGVPGAVPAYAFVDRERGRLVRMWQHEPAAAVEERLAAHRPLLEGGSSYVNVYRGGSVEARFCMASLGWTDPFRTRHPFAIPALVVLYCSDLIRAAILVGGELLVAAGGVLPNVARGQDLGSELKFAGSRVAVAVALRELTALSARVDMARGLPVIYLNLLGYDEFAHRRGPSSPAAGHALRQIDRVIRDLEHAARRSRRRAYQVWVLSDHGQEATVPYIERCGRSVQDAVAEVFRAHGIAPDGAEPGPDAPRHRSEIIRHRVVKLLRPAVGLATERWKPGMLAVTAQGPLGHVYSPRPLDGAERDAIASSLVRDASIPLVLAAGAPGAACAWTRDGTWTLPADAARILGEDHPYLDAVTSDLVALCHHRDAGDLVISGWQLGASPMSFPHENGSHAGPGPSETDAFTLVPPEAPLAPSAPRPTRPADVRRAAFEVLDDAGGNDGTIRRDPATAVPVQATMPETVRLLTYNVHSCLGLDGMLSVERVARTIARQDPDVVALQELDVGRARTGGVDQAMAIAARMEMYLHFHPAISVGEEHYGDAILSRLPMRVLRAGELPRLSGMEPRGALMVEIGAPPASFQLINTHLSLHPRERAMQIASLLGPDWLGAIPPGQAVLCGDLNAFGWFPVCRRLARTLRDAQAGRRGHRPRGTWPAGLHFGRIDHVFVDPAVEVVHVRVCDDALAAVASDHAPLLVRLRWPQAATPASAGGRQ